MPFLPYHVSSDFLIAAGRQAGMDLTGNLLGDKAVSLVFDNSKIRRFAPAMKTTVPFREGVERVLRYLDEHPEAQAEDPEFDRWCDRVIEAQEEAKKKFLG